MRALFRGHPGSGESNYTSHRSRPEPRLSRFERARGHCVPFGRSRMATRQPHDESADTRILVLRSRQTGRFSVVPGHDCWGNNSGLLALLLHGP